MTVVTQLAYSQSGNHNSNVTFMGVYIW